jgi:hypothetical protein
MPTTHPKPPRWPASTPANAPQKGLHRWLNEVVGADIKGLQGQALPLRAAPEEWIKYCFPRSGVDARRVDQHTIKIENHRVKIGPGYRY